MVASVVAGSEAILALNSGSSSLKFALFAPGPEDEKLLLEGVAEGIERGDGRLSIRSGTGESLLERHHIIESQAQALGQLAEVLQGDVGIPPIAIGHRIVHGGPRLRTHQRLTDDICQMLAADAHFAPLHIPQALRLFHQAKEAFPGAPHFACFDTAFHRMMPEIAAHLPLPRRYFDEGILRYGFHGLSYESVIHRLGKALPPRAVLAHLGNGASVTAVMNGRSIDTSMGLTPTGGMPMGTRSGDLDPAILLHLMRHESLTADELETLLDRRSGLAGLSGGESDVQQLLRRSIAGDDAAEFALSVFCIGARKYIGAYAALMGGIDLLVFTGGIGEHSGEIRARICDGLGFLGLSSSGERGSKVIAMRSEEELQIARHTRSMWVKERAADPQTALA